MITKIKKFIQMNKPATERASGVKYVAGFVILFNNKILLAHATKHPKNSKFTFPKGQIDNYSLTKNTILNTAIREVYEETKLKIDKNEVDTTTLYKIKIRNNNKLVKVVYYYVVNLQKIDKDIIDKKNLQLKEIDWCGFLTKKEAEKVIDPKYVSILKFLK
jgi:ADP-ribose pyrophosphatase YjhB (NUDIX family)